MTAKTPMLLALGALALAACTQPARTPPPQPVAVAAAVPPKERLVAAIEAEGCVFTRANSGAVLLRANLTQAEAVPLINELGNEGRAEAGGSEGAESIRILSDNCI